MAANSKALFLFRFCENWRLFWCFETIFSSLLNLSVKKMFFKEFTLAIFILILQNLDASCGAKIRPFLSTHRYRQSVFDPSSFSHTMTLGMNWRNFHCNFISCAYNNFYPVKKAHSQDHNISHTPNDKHWFDQILFFLELQMRETDFIELKNWYSIDESRQI